MKEILQKYIQLFLKERGWLIITCVLLLVIAVFTYHFMSKDKNAGVLLSKEAVNDLVDKAADQKYIQKVFNTSDSFKPLPLPKKPSIDFKTPPEEMLAVKSASAKEVVSQRCTYKGQSYVVGDIVKTEQEWVRCTPTIVFIEKEDKEKGVAIVKQAGSAVWTLVQ